MSNPPIFDSLLVRHLARELDGRLRGRACAAALSFPGKRRALLQLDGGEALELDLHPRRGVVRIVPWSGPDELEGTCAGVEAPADERVLSVRIDVSDRYRAERRLVFVELLTNQWNALLVGADGRTLSAAWSRSAGAREIRAGVEYRPPPYRPRFGADAVSEPEARATWRGAFEHATPETLRRVLLEGFAYTSSINAGHVMGPEAERPEGKIGDLGGMFRRWWSLREPNGTRPVLLRLPGRLLPYPVPLDETDSEPLASLLAGMDRVATAAEGVPLPTGDPDLLPRIRARAASVARRLVRLQEQLAAAGLAAEMRTRGDLLLARLHGVPRGTSSVTLEGWDGEDVLIALDPALSPVENADAFYEEARRRGRAAEQLPGMIEAAERERERWWRALSAAEGGEVSEGLRQELQGDEDERSRAPAGTTLPFRRYRTSGGLEVRVGRSARANDQLTFHHSAPDDVWLHARSVPGSHVILRWTDGEGAPPARDLAEAATLAAVFSRARSSGLVPVDWTRRKHVRKPRGAPPGAVIPQRVKTLFVEPDVAKAERMRID